LIIIHGLPIFVDFVDSTKPRIIIHDEYLSLYLNVLIITRVLRIIIHDEYLSLYLYVTQTYPNGVMEKWERCHITVDEKYFLLSTVHET
jgi:hypothetical protein